MSVIFWNCAGGLVAKIDFINYTLSAFSPEILFVSEAEINLNKNYDCVKVPGYKLEVSKTISHGKARQAAYVKNSSDVVRRPDLENGVSEVIVFSNARSVICGVYRPFKNIQGTSPSQALTNLLECLNRVVETHKDVIVGGDFNVNWLSQSAFKNRVEEWAEGNGLLQNVMKSTRHRTVRSRDGNSEQASLIDLVFSKEPIKLDLHDIGCSDHLAIQVRLKTLKPKNDFSKRIVTVDWRNYSKEAVCAAWPKHLHLLDSQDDVRNLQIINSCLVAVSNEVAPKRVVKLRSQKEFVNSKIEAVKKKRDRTFKKFKKTGDIKYKDKARELTKVLKKIIAKERKRVFRAKMGSHGSK